MAPKHCGYKSREAYEMMRAFMLLDAIARGEIKPPHDSVAYDKWAKKNKIYLSQMQIRSYMAGKPKMPPRVYFPVEDSTVEMTDVFSDGKDYSENVMRIVRAMSSDSPVSLDKFNWVPANARVEFADIGRTLHYTEIGDMAHQAYQDALRKGKVAMMRPGHGPNKEVVR